MTRDAIDTRTDTRTPGSARLGPSQAIGRRSLLLLACAGALVALPARAEPGAVPPSGLWDASVTVGAVEIPFRLELAVSGSQASGAFFNGEERVRSTSGSFVDGNLTLRFDHYASALRARWVEGKLAGSYERPGTSYVLRALPRAPGGAAAAAGSVPAIAGQWEIGVNSPKGESAWRFFVRQSGASVSASILRVDGDTGQLEGSYRDGAFVLSHFSGARPLLLRITPGPDGTLSILENGKTTYTATKSGEARARHLPEPADPSRWTSVDDPSQPLRFAGKSLDGQAVSFDDPRFRGKVVLLNIMGSWCPNCHDEAPFLAALDRKYRRRGLEVVSLSFEDAEQLANPSRLRAFIATYGLEYTVLLGGEPSQLAQQLPQAVRLNTWPASFFIGRDGLVRGAHAGFAGKATGVAHQQLVAELTATVEKLLAEKAPAAAR